MLLGSFYLCVRVCYRTFIKLSLVLNPLLKTFNIRSFNNLRFINILILALKKRSSKSAAIPVSTQCRHLMKLLPHIFSLKKDFLKIAPSRKTFLKLPFQNDPIMMLNLLFNIIFFIIIFFIIVILIRFFFIRVSFIRGNF